MNRSTFRTGILLLGLMLLLGASPVLADGDGNSGTDPAEGLSGEASAVFAPRLGQAPAGVAPAPFRLLTPIRDLLSGSVWLMTMNLDPRSSALSRVAGASSLAPAPGLAWQGLREIYVAPGAGPGQPQTSAPAAPSAQALVPFRDPAPSFSRDILVTRDFSNSPLQTEPMIAVNPNDPEHLLLGTVDYNFPNVTAYVSFDGGATWEGPQQPHFLRDDLGAGGDPIVGFDREGNAYLGFISIGVEEFTVGPALDFATVSSIAVSRSTDGGLTWEEPVSSARSGFERDVYSDEQGRTRGVIGLSFLDKPWIDIGPNPSNSSRDSIYVTYTKFTTQYSIFSIGELPFFGLPVVETVIEIVRSDDGGRTWTNPVAVSPTVRRIYGDNPEADEDGEGTERLQDGGDGDGDGDEGGEDGEEEEEERSNAIGSKRTVQGSQPAVAPNGDVYVAWMDSTDDKAFEGLAEIYVARSEDGGTTFEKPVRASVLNEPGFAPRRSFFRYWGSVFPQLDTGSNGEVYVVYTALPPDKKNDDGDVYVVRSLDRGDSWGRPTRLNDDATNRLQFFPSVTVDPKGVVHAMWGDMRDDRASTRYHIYYTNSEDRGDTWGFVDPELDFRTQNTRVTDFPSNPNKGFPGGLFIGDYFSIAASENEVYLVWADTRLGEYGPINQKIGFTRRSAIQAPEVFMSPPAGSGGQSVDLQGFNFQPDTSIFIQVGGVVVSTLRTNDQGRFTTELFIPVAGYGAHNVQVFDESGNFATSSFFMEFGFDTVKEVQEDLAQQVEALSGTLEGIDSRVAESVRSELDQLRGALASAPTAPAPAAPTPAPGPAMEPSTAGAADWWVLLIAVLAAFVVGSAAAVVVMRMTGSRRQQNRRWDTLD